MALDPELRGRDLGQQRRETLGCLRTDLMRETLGGTEVGDGPVLVSAKSEHVDRRRVGGRRILIVRVLAPAFEPPILIEVQVLGVELQPVVLGIPRWPDWMRVEQGEERIVLAG